MVNVRQIGKQFTKEEGKNLLDDAQKIIDEKILGPKFKRNKLLDTDKKQKVTIDGQAEEVVDGQLTTKVKTKVDVPKPDERADQILYKIKAGGKITPQKLDDFNINKIQSKEDILKFIDEISESYKKDIGNRKRNVQTNEATKALADILQKDQTKLSATLLNLKKGDTLNAEYILATRELVEASMAKLDELAVKAISGTPDDVLKYRQQMALTSQLQKILKGVQTETARALQQFSIPTRTKKFTNVNLDELNKTELLLELGGEEQIRGMAKAYLTVQTKQGRSKLVEGAGLTTKISEAFSEVFINAILSNPLTHVRNTAGNWITQGIIQLERGIESKLFNNALAGGVAEFEDLAKAYGRTQATTEMWAEMGRSLKNIDKIESFIAGNKAEVRQGKFTAENFNAAEGSVLANFLDYGGKIATLGRIPTKLLTYSDNFFKNREYRSEVYALAYRDTVKKVREGILKKEDAATYLADLVVNPTAQMVEQAKEATLYSVYQTKLGTRGDFLDAGAHLQKLKNNTGVLNFFANYYLPFIQTPTNVAGFALERTPVLNLLLKSYRDDLFSNEPARQAKAKAKMMLGASFYTTVMGMTYGGYATGTSPELGTMFKADGSKFALKKALGVGDGTINIPYGDETYRISVRDTLFDPVAMMFKQASDLAKIAEMGFSDNDQWQDYLKITSALIYSFGENLADSTFMSGVGKFIEDYQTFDQLGLQKGGERWGQKVGTSFIPTIFKQGAKAVDLLQGETNQRLAVEFNEYVKKALGYNELNTEYDIYGEPVERWGTWTKEKKGPHLDALKETQTEVLPVRRAKTFTKNNLSVNVEYTSDELRFLQKRSGDYARENVNQLLENSEYLEAEDNFYKQALIKKAFQAARETAYGDLIGSGPNPYSSSEETRNRIELKAQELFEQKILTNNLGKPILGNYFGEE